MMTVPHPFCKTYLNPVDFGFCTHINATQVLVVKDKEFTPGHQPLGNDRLLLITPTQVLSFCGS